MAFPVTSFAKDWIYVALEGDDKIVRIDGDSGAIIGDGPVAKGPCDVAFAPESKFLAVSHVDSWGDILFLDRETLKVLHKVRLQGDGKSRTECFYLAFNKDGRKLYATNRYTGVLYVIDVQATKKIKSIRLNGEKLQKTFKPALSPDGKRLYIPGLTTGNIFVLDTSDDVLKETISIKDVAQGPLVVSQDGKQLYVTEGKNLSLDILDIKTRSRVKRIPIGLGPVDVAVSPDGRFVYVLNMGSQSVTVVDTKLGEAVANIDVAFFPMNIKLSPDGKRLYVSNWGEGQINIIDTVTFREIIRVPDIGKGPLGVEVYQSP